MIAGNRESREPGIGERVERFLIVVFSSLGTTPRPTAYTAHHEATPEGTTQPLASPRDVPEGQ
jgi:hypothetical protein